MGVTDVEQIDTSFAVTEGYPWINNPSSLNSSDHAIDRTGDAAVDKALNEAKKPEERVRRVVSASTVTFARTGDLALLWLQRMQIEAKSAGYEWLEPHATYYNDEFVFEWWRGERKLSLYISGFDAQIIKVWGHNMDSDMESLTDPTRTQTLLAWAWLLTGAC
jgi:hypothetical protein